MVQNGYNYLRYCALSSEEPLHCQESKYKCELSSQFHAGSQVDKISMYMRRILPETAGFLAGLLHPVEPRYMILPFSRAHGGIRIRELHSHQVLIPSEALLYWFCELVIL